MAPEEDAHPLSSYELLNLAENHLRLRNYSLSRQYALESLHADADADADGSSLRDRAQQIVAASDVLSAASETEHNCYSVLGVDTFCSDMNLIRSRFRSLVSLLGPVRPTFPAADEAMSCAWKAWNVLGSPANKSQLDARLSAALARPGAPSFWTLCPYCFCMYEYAGAFEGYCLRCQNPACRRAFQGLPTPTPPPNGHDDPCFTCFAYFPLGNGMQQHPPPTWSPFVGMFHRPTTSAAFVDISDDTNGSAPTSTQLPGPASHVRYGPNRYGKMLMHTHPSDAMPDEGFDVQDDSDQYHPDYGFVSQGACTGGPGLECHFEADVQFVEKDGEIFLEMPSGSAAEH